MRFWSPWDDQLLRALRGEFRLHAPLIAFDRGEEGGVAVFYDQAQLGLWIATSQHRFRYIPQENPEAAADPYDIMDIIDAHYVLFTDLLGSVTHTS
jgi:hypothetical protein